ncbi:MAG TPA: histidine triad nucleotide-binding protein [Pseudomonadales bacterium]|nr:histidine triad nucleotide-binding protein [Pseudomonadales bacterium]
MSEDCLFCKIANNQIPADVVYEDDEVIAINDISPQAPVHLLVLPKRHISTLNDLSTEDRLLCGSLPLTAQKLAAERGIAESGYRLVMNCNAEGGQTVFHIHMHLLGGRQLTRLG